MIDQTQGKDVGHPVNRNALVEQLQVHVINDCRTAERRDQIDSPDRMLDDDLIQIADMPQY
ncbi:hypothetical protein D3C84_928290 [compost metagenome]